MRFVIMQGTVGYRPDEAAAEEPISGQEGTVLRLLLLHRKNSLTREEIARHLTRRGLRAVRPQSVPGYIARLRSKVGPWCVTSMRGGYSSDMDSGDVDAFVFKRLIEEYGVADISDVDNMDDSWAEKYEQLLELHAMWRVNPALPFDDEDDDFLAATYHEFDRYWDYLQRCIIYSELRSRRKPRIEKAADRLDQLLRQDPDDEQSWALLLRARASLPGSETAVSGVLTRIQARYPAGMPAELRYTISRITSGHRDALFAIDRSPRTNEDTERVNRLVRTIGISPASELELRRSKLEPLECISQTVSQLCFAGILATKWVTDSYVRAQFARLLERLDHSGGSARFLLIDPESESYVLFSRLRWSEGGAQPVDTLRKLSVAHPSFQVRLYDALPTFRIVLIDQSIVSFSPYLMDAGTERARTGWEAPHVVLDRTAPWPLARTFETLFAETWRTATPLERRLARQGPGSCGQLVMGCHQRQCPLGVGDFAVPGGT